MAGIDALLFGGSRCSGSAGWWTTWPEKDPESAVTVSENLMRRMVYGPSYQKPRTTVPGEPIGSAFHAWLDLKEVKKSGIRFGNDITYTRCGKAFSTSWLFAGSVLPAPTLLSGKLFQRLDTGISLAGIGDCFLPVRRKSTDVSLDQGCQFTPG